MAHVLQVTDGTTTVNLTGGTVSLRAYAPKTPDVSVVEAAAWAMEDGGQVRQVTRRNVTETAEVTIAATSAANLRAQSQVLETLFRQAEEYQRRRMGARVYVQFQPDGDAASYRSELLYGKLEVAESWRPFWGEYAMEAAVIWRRRHYWEGPEVELPLTNGGGSGTGGQTIYNHDDAGAGHDNYVAIDGDDVDGVIPAPARIEITNSYNSAVRSKHFWLSLNAFSNPGSLTHILEAEDGTGGSTQSDSAASGGYRKDCTLSGDTEQEILRWTLSSALLNACAGNWFQILARFTSGTGLSDTKFRFKILYNNVTMWEGVQVQPDSNYAHVIRPLGSIQLPPWLPGATSLTAMTLVLTAQRVGGGTVALDFLQLSPVDGYRYLLPYGYAVAYTERLVDDGIADQIYVDSGAGTSRRGNYIGYGRPLHVWPGRDQRIYTLIHSSNADQAEILRTSSLRAYYRPRRLTL